MASDSESTTITEGGTPSLGLAEVITSVKQFSSAELFKLLKAVISATEKKAKATLKAATHTEKAAARAAKKIGSMPKGTIPPQFKKPRAWLDYTLKDILENGWEPFTVLNKKKGEQIEMPGSVLHNGPDGPIHIYDGSVTEKTPNGKQPIPKDAMSISKIRKEAGHTSYALFEASYVATTVTTTTADAVEAVEAPSSDDKSVVDAPSNEEEVVVEKPVAKKAVATKKTVAAKKLSVADTDGEPALVVPKKAMKKKTSTTATTTTTDSSK